jgi:hypothetical protein
LGFGTAQIEHNLPNNYYLDWDGQTYNMDYELAMSHDAYSHCTVTTDGAGNYAANAGDYTSYYGC